MIQDEAPSLSGADAREALPSVVERAAATVEAIWTNPHPAVYTLRKLAARLQQDFLQLAILGQFKRGKSAFINALIGAPVLPTSVVPATALPTFLRWGPHPLIRVSYTYQRPTKEIMPGTLAGVRRELEALVTEAGNPENRRRIARVEVRLPADILRSGVVLIDTPGIGSTLRHNTETARHVLPECDAALFVLSVDPPITEAELAYLAEIRPHVVRLDFVLNKVDLLDPFERAEATDFLLRALRQVEPDDRKVRLHVVSARQALDAQLRHNPSRLVESGLPAFERDVIRDLAQRKTSSLHASARGKALAILGAAAGELALELRGLELPLDDLAARARTLQEALANAEDERRAAQDRIEGDRRRCVAELEADARHLREEGRTRLSGLVRETVGAKGILDPSEVHQLLDSAVPKFFDEQLATISARFHRRVDTMIAYHLARADALVRTVRRTTGTLFDVVLPEPPLRQSFRMGRAPYWVAEHIEAAVIPPPTRFVAGLLSRRRREERRRREIEIGLVALVQRNVENLRWATLVALNETFRRFSAQLDERFGEVLRATRGAVARTVECRKTQGDQIEAEVRRLKSCAQELAAIRGQLEAGHEPL